MEIAVVIPALDEGARIETAIRAALGPGMPGKAARTGSSQHDVWPEQVAAPAEAEGRSTVAEDGAWGRVDLVVVDGGSRDDTIERARAAGARVLQSERGRARQLQLGWRETTGDAVLFLHADTRLGAGWREAIARALEDPEVVGGAFALRFDASMRALRVVEFFVAVRVRLFGLPYGDQGIFVRRRILEAIGGIPDVDLMEDLDLVAAMKAHGRVVVVPPPATTSARRYAERGVWQTVARHLLALMGWRLGVDRRRIAGWVRR